MGAGAILGFANFLLRFYETESPRSVVVGWDTLDQPTYRHISSPRLSGWPHLRQRAARSAKRPAGIRHRLRLLLSQGRGL